MIARTPDTPPIPNFEILGRIGGGSYGEVYLARTVTGMFRAVKVVRREDFEYQRTFEREFQGIQHYEKLSHEHPGLVDILHVGRDDEAGFYYYVMELADDESGASAEEVLDHYRPRTLSSDLRKSSSQTVRQCVDLGIAIGSALGHLHRAGLTHRDVKPSNIIFVKGQPKLADVGLVASTGQRTFVGTEGYVPPEGPGTSSADLYSLAMVLYEMHTGKDRLDFPELPTNLEIHPSVNRDEWRALNAVICRAGSPDPRKRYDSAAELVRALETVCAVTWKAPEPRRSAVPAFFGTLAVLGILAMTGFGGWWLWKDQKQFVEKHSDLLSDAGSKGGVNGAGLRTPVAPVKPIRTEEPKGGDSPTPEGPVEPPARDPKEDVAETGNEVEKGKATEKTETIASAEGEKGKTTSPEESGDKPDEKNMPALVATEVKGTREDPPAGPKPLKAEVVRGQVKITSVPPAASVYLDGKEVGITETRLLEFEVGPIELVLRRSGYRDFVYRGEVKEGVQIIDAVLLPDLGPVVGQAWVNSLGMEFRAIPVDRHQSVEEVSVAVFDQFLEETNLPIPRTGERGIANVPEDRALWQFSDWLTEKDRVSGYLGTRHYYRPQRNETVGRGGSFFVTIEHDFGTLVLNSEPSGARVFREGKDLGRTPVVLNDLRLGYFDFELHKAGHKVGVAMGDLSETQAQDLVVSLELDDSAVFGSPWTNGQGMEMVPVGDLLVARTETPSRAYLEFLADKGLALPPGATAGLHYPAVGISHADAVGFCDWLTSRELAAGKIRPWQRYRLPTDLEWSLMAGLKGESGETPAERSGDGGFIWGGAWPPPPGTGNFADLSASAYFGGKVIEGYNDGFATTAPVGSFAPSPGGLLDLSGNVWEWVSDPYTDGSDSLMVVRGGGWNSSDREVLATAYRNPVPATAREDYYGFRYVLEDAEPDAP